MKESPPPSTNVRRHNGRLYSWLRESAFHSIYGTKVLASCGPIQTTGRLIRARTAWYQAALTFLYTTLVFQLLVHLFPTLQNSVYYTYIHNALPSIHTPYLCFVKFKGKGHPRTGREGPEGEQRYSSTLSLTLALDGVGGQHHAPAALPPIKTRYPMYRRLGGLQGRSGRMRKISPSLGFDPRTVQSVVSRYTD